MNNEKYILRFPQPNWSKRLHTYYTGRTPTTRIWKAKIFDTIKDAFNKRKYAQTARCTQVIKVTDKGLFKAQLKGT